MYLFIGGFLAILSIIPSFILALKMFNNGREYSKADWDDKIAAIGVTFLCALFTLILWPLFLAVVLLFLFYRAAESGIEKFYNRFTGNSRDGNSKE